MNQIHYLEYKARQNFLRQNFKLLIHDFASISIHRRFYAFKHPYYATKHSYLYLPFAFLRLLESFTNRLTKQILL